jgi:hypothetical protein
MDENLNSYNKRDIKIDKYLGTKNLIPGPPRKLINKKILGNEGNSDKVYKIQKEQPKQKINFSSYSMEIKTGVNWSEYNT